MSVPMSLMKVTKVLTACAFVSACGGPEASDPIDLMDASYVVFAPVDEQEIPTRIQLDGDTRRSLAASTPSEFRYRIQIPERALLTFAVAIITAPGADRDRPLPGDHVNFALRAGESAASELLFERSIHVARRGQWIEQEVDLRGLAGKTVWLVFQTSFPGAPEGEALPVVGIFGEPVLHDRARYRQGRGVVVVSIDTLRRDHVSLYGYPRRTTPGLEALATESVVFDDAVSTASWTLPAHASLLTSTYPSVHGAVNLNVGLSPAWPSVATLLQEAEFTTQAFVTHVYLSTEYGFGEGFDRHVYLPETRAEEVTNRAIRFLRAMGDREFFLFVHYYDPHWHYDPPAPYDKTFDPSYDGDTSGVWWDFKELDRDSIDPRDLHHIEALYDGEILYTDRHLERLMRAMKELDIFDKSLIVVTSDHGEEFLEHGSWEHQKTLYEEQLRVPLIIKFPDGEGAGRRVSEQVSLLDIAPTIADVMGLSVPATFRGVSLRGEVLENRALWSETEHTIDGTHKLSLRRGSSAGKAIFSVRDDGVDVELFDLGEDPNELEAVTDDDMRQRVEQQLRDYLAGVAVAREGKTDTPNVELDPQDRERLRALGYIQ